MNEPFVFSFIMAVYNVELYLREAIDSIIQQTLDFRRIQLILVDDGTPDSSRAICDEYAAKYPENILVIHKENGGVSSARNAGLRVATGEFVCFIDSDDMLSANTCSHVYHFIREHGEETDVVAIPMVYFEGKNQEHVLNYKFEKGSRIIDLRQEYNAVQMSTSSAFIRRAAIDIHGPLFDETQKYAEDATFLQPILWKKMTLGVVADCKYMYRFRAMGPVSAVQNSLANREWWLDYLLKFPHRIIENAINQLGEVPLFCQYVIAYHLQWRIMEESFPRDILTDQEIEEYWNELIWIYQHIEDKIILEQKNIGLEHKMHILKKKYGFMPEPTIKEDELICVFSQDTQIPLMSMKARLDFFELSDGYACIEGHIPCLWLEDDRMTIGVRVNQEFYPSEEIVLRKPLRSLDEDIVSFRGFKAKIPIHADEKTEYRFAFVIKYQDSFFEFCGIAPLPFFPISKVYDTAYYARGHWIADFEESELVIRRQTKTEHCLHEIRFLREIWKKNLEGGRKAVPVRILRHVLKRIKRKELWLISDRVLKADDNGEAFFIYLNQLKEKNIRTCFVIGKDSVDRDRIRKIGKVVHHFSFRHKLMRLLCDYNISSAAEDSVVNPFSGHHEAYRDILWDTKYVFLQHGITKDDQTKWLNRFNKNIDGFVTSATPEYQSILEGAYHYSTEQVWLTGMPRYDRLYHQEENLIALMPTWRRYLMDRYDVKTGVWTISKRFVESEYFQFYNGLMNHPRLLEAMKAKGYRMLFLPHPNLIPHLHFFHSNELVDMGTPDIRYRDVYAKSKLVVSDYSSAVFDFSYLRKPIVYSQFDAQEFFSGGHMYRKGYFEYERDGFGEVTYNLEETVNQIIEYMENDCKLKEKYRKRIDQFFAFNDQENCRRVYEKIRSMK